MDELIDEKMVDYIRRTAGGRGREWALQCCRIGAWRARTKFGDAATRGHAFNFARATARDDRAGERKVYRRFSLCEHVEQVFYVNIVSTAESAPAPEIATPEERIDAARAYAAMPAWLQTVLRLHAQGLSSREIAAGMQMPHRTVLSWLAGRPATAPSGAPTRAKPEAKQVALEVLAAGGSRKDAARAAGVPEGSVCRWVKAQATVPAAPGARTRARSPGRK